ncbi:ATP-binding protein [Oscillibacter sp.]|uniref:AlbA family DNA-binding domain-containing protein n=1 Tax=Oscillibacter sp. TaxID=1945593 RepID=UPI00257D9EBB|nr:ATP-binding protein [Oscillibacter sp.]
MYDVYDIVCFFSNRDGGTIILGVKDNGAILGVEADAVDRIEKDFVTSTNNGQEINPPLFTCNQDPAQWMAAATNPISTLLIILTCFTNCMRGKAVAIL